MPRQRLTKSMVAEHTPSLAPPPGQRAVSLCEALDRVLAKGAVVRGEIVISVAGVELIGIGLQSIIASVETIRSSMDPVGGAR